MEIRLKGSDKSIKRFLEVNKLWLKRNAIDVLKSKEVKSEVKTEAVETEKPIRKRRTKEQIEEDKNK